MKQLKGIDSNTVVHCPTEELSDKVLKIAKDAGYSPFLVNSMYCHYEKDTCYNLMNATFSNISYYKNIKDYKILPAEEFIKLNTMKQLPEKWAIKTDDLPQEFYDWIDKNCLEKDDRIDFKSLSGLFIHVPHTASILISEKFGFWSGDSILQDGYEEITIEQWREAVSPYNKIEFNASEETGELIGYEAPFDIPKWNTKKGDLWTYTKNGWYEFKDEALPAEWVETWKPVYKAKEKKRVPKSGWIIYDPIEQRTIFKDGKKDEPFLIQAECIYWVQQNGLLGHFYSFLEVDYITEE